MTWAENIGIPKIHRNQKADERLLPPEVMTWAENLPGSARGIGGMLLAGPTGSGKTFAAAWMLQQLHATTWFKENGEEVGPFERIGARFIRCHDAINAIARRNKNQDDRASLRAWAEVDVLVIDDWPEEVVGWIVDSLEDLVDRRYAEELLTIVTTNAVAGVEGANTFEGRYPRAASRILDARGPGLVVLNRGSLRR